MALFDNTFGVEIECILPLGMSHAAAAAAVTAAGVTCQSMSYNHLVQPTWKVVTDGSLGDYQRGAEFVSPILRGEYGLETLKTVMDTLARIGCKVNKACGLHVHVAPAGVGGVSEMPFMRNLYKLYAHFEPTIDAMMPASRRASTNTYCRSITHLSFARVDAAVNLRQLLTMMSRTEHAQRYFKLNLKSWLRYQTVEFRQHGGTVESVKAVEWVRFCLGMVERAKGGPVDFGGSVGGGAINRAKVGTATFQVGEMFLRPEGVTRQEAMAATGWPSISLPATATACGLGYTTQRIGRNVRYFAQAAQASAAIPATLRGLVATLGLDEAQASYFTARTLRFTGTVMEEAA